jgi:hypothetical protein
MWFAQAQLEPGTSANNFRNGRTEPFLGVTLGWAERLVITSTGGATTATVTANRATLEAPDGRSITVRNVNLTLNIANTGANGRDTGARSANWWHVWLISNGDETRGLLSLSDSNPVMPTGYFFKARQGIVYDDATSLRKSKQLDQRLITADQTIMNAAVAANDTWEAIPTATAKIPPTAIATSGWVARTSEAAPKSVNFAVASDTTAFGQKYLLTEGPSTSWTSGGVTRRAACPFTVTLGTAQSFAVKSESNTPTHEVVVNEFELT